MDDVLKTYIEGFDEQLGGGMSKGHVVLISGPPGSMKSSLSLHICYNNLVADGTKSLYISLEERKESLTKSMKMLNMGDFDEKGLIIADLGKLRAAYKETDQTQDWFTILRSYIHKRVTEENIKIVVIDSLTALYTLSDLMNPRQHIFRFFSFLKGLGINTLLTSEVAGDSIYGMYHEDFLADGTLLLKFYEASDTSIQLRIRIVKMRHSKHYQGYMALLIKNGKFMVTPVISD